MKGDISRCTFVFSERPKTFSMYHLHPLMLHVYGSRLQLLGIVTSSIQNASLAGQKCGMLRHYLQLYLKILYVAQWERLYVRPLPWTNRSHLSGLVSRYIKAECLSALVCVRVCLPASYQTELHLLCGRCTVQDMMWCTTRVPYTVYIQSMTVIGIFLQISGMNSLVLWSQSTTFFFGGGDNFAYRKRFIWAVHASELEWLYSCMRSLIAWS